jgi:hypothetical protein
LAANAHVHANVHHSSELCVVIWSQLSYRNWNVWSINKIYTLVDFTWSGSCRYGIM